MRLEMPYLCARYLVGVPGGLVFRRRYLLVQDCVCLSLLGVKVEIRCDCKFTVVDNMIWLQKYYVGGANFLALSAILDYYE